MERKILRNIENSKTYSLEEVGLININIIRVWTILDEVKLFEGDKFNPYTGEKLEAVIPKDLTNPNLVHGVSVFIEDKIHDWNINQEKFRYYSRVNKKGGTADLLIEFEH